MYDVFPFLSQQVSPPAAQHSAAQPSSSANGGGSSSSPREGVLEGPSAGLPFAGLELVGVKGGSEPSLEAGEGKPGVSEAVTVDAEGRAAEYDSGTDHGAEEGSGRAPSPVAADSSRGIHGRRDAATAAAAKGPGAEHVSGGYQVPGNDSPKLVAEVSEGAKEIGGRRSREKPASAEPEETKAKPASELGAAKEAKGDKKHAALERIGEEFVCPVTQVIV